MDGIDTHMTGTSADSATESQPSGQGSSHSPKNTSSAAGGTLKPVVNGYTLATKGILSFADVFNDDQSDAAAKPAPFVWPSESDAARKALEAFNATTLPHGA